MRIAVSLVLVALLVGATAATVSARGKDWGEIPPHGHVMLLHASIDGGNLYFDRCVEFAAGRALPNAAHHESVHTGVPGGSPFVQGKLFQAGHIVAPLSPLVPFDWTGCESFHSGMALP